MGYRHYAQTCARDERRRYEHNNGTTHSRSPADSNADFTQGTKHKQLAAVSTSVYAFAELRSLSVTRPQYMSHQVKGGMDQLGYRLGEHQDLVAETGIKGVSFEEVDVVGKDAG